MNSSTCAVIAEVLPVLLLAIVLETGRIHPTIKRRRFFQPSREAGLMASIIGIPFAVVGVSLNGLDWRSCWAVWGCFAVALFSFGFLLMLLVATKEFEDETDA